MPSLPRTDTVPTALPALLQALVFPQLYYCSSWNICHHLDVLRARSEENQLGMHWVGWVLDDLFWFHPFSQSVSYIIHISLQVLWSGHVVRVLLNLYNQNRINCTQANHQFSTLVQQCQVYLGREGGCGIGGNKTYLKGWWITRLKFLLEDLTILEHSNRHDITLHATPGV